MVFPMHTKLFLRLLYLKFWQTKVSKTEKEKNCEAYAKKNPLKSHKLYFYTY